MPSPNSRKRSLWRSITDWWADFWHGSTKRVGNATDYFEWIVHRSLTGIGTVLSGIGSLFGLLLPKKWIAKTQRQRAIRAAERAEKADESLVNRASETLEVSTHRFLSSVGSAFSMLFQLVFPAKLVKKTEQVVADTTSSAVSGLRDRLEAIGKRFAPVWLQKLVGRVYDAFADVLSFFSVWFHSRDFMALAWSVPALLLGIPILGSIGLAMAYSSDSKIQHYRGALLEAIEERDVEREQLCFNKLSQLGYERTERAEFSAALELAEEDKWDEAVARMEAIAPLDGNGFPAAHLWIGSDLITRRANEEGMWKEAEAHADRVLELATSADRQTEVSAKVLLIDIYNNTLRKEQAVTLMHEVADNHPVIHLELMLHYLRSQDDQTAQRHAQQADSYFQVLAAQEANPSISSTKSGDDSIGSDAETLDAVAFGRWAIAKRLLGQRQKSIDTLETGLQLFPKNEMLKSELIKLLLQAASNDDVASEETIAALQRIIALAPDELNSAEGRVTNWLIGRWSEKDDRAVMQDMAKLRAAKALPTQALMSMGDKHTSVKDFAMAVRYYSAAAKQDPTQAIAMNNVAWILGNVEPKQSARAIEFATKAISIRQEARFFETRGQIYLATGQHEKAIEDLESAMNRNYPEPNVIHKALAEAYQALGNTELADAHRNLASR